jgi:hypothetical protein
MNEGYIIAAREIRLQYESGKPFIVTAETLDHLRFKGVQDINPNTGVTPTMCPSILWSPKSIELQKACQIKYRPEFKDYIYNF